MRTKMIARIMGALFFIEWGGFLFYARFSLSIIMNQIFQSFPIFCRNNSRSR